LVRLRVGFALRDLEFTRGGALFGSSDAFERGNGQASTIAIAVHDKLQRTALSGSVPGHTSGFRKLGRNRLHLIFRHASPHNTRQKLGLMS
jgi:hypothetical protein